jgi:hypothetical protein
MAAPATTGSKSAIFKDPPRRYDNYGSTLPGDGNGLWRTELLGTPTHQVPRIPTF